MRAPPQYPSRSEARRSPKAKEALCGVTLCSFQLVPRIQRRLSHIHVHRLFDDYRLLGVLARRVSIFSPSSDSGLRDAIAFLRCPGPVARSHSRSTVSSTAASILSAAVAFAVADRAHRVRSLGYGVWKWEVSKWSTSPQPCIIGDAVHPYARDQKGASRRTYVVHMLDHQYPRGPWPRSWCSTPSERCVSRGSSRRSS